METSSLQKADILLSTGEATESTAIRLLSASRFSHAALYSGDGKIIEAVGEGVVDPSLATAISDDTLVAVYRRRGMSSALSNAVIRYAQRQLGKSYDYTGALGAGATSVPGAAAVAVMPIGTGPIALASDIANRLFPESSFFCSELVAMAYKNANVPITSGAASTTPADLANAETLSLVGYLKGGD